jgi:hypothetical protein
MIPDQYTVPLDLITETSPAESGLLRVQPTYWHATLLSQPPKQIMLNGAFYVIFPQPAPTCGNVTTLSPVDPSTNSPHKYTQPRQALNPAFKDRRPRIHSFKINQQKGHQTAPNYEYHACLACLDVPASASVNWAYHRSPDPVDVTATRPLSHSQPRECLAQPPFYSRHRCHIPYLPEPVGH